MNRSALIQQIFTKKSYLCVGLDTDITKFPKGVPPTTEGMLQFNKAIIDATKDYCVSYKINTAFYEALGAAGWGVMEQTLAYIPKTHFTIADAKRGDIGNTSTQYANAFFKHLSFDAVTVAPYMGSDSVQPFLAFKDKWSILLGLTSNKGAADFEQLMVQQTEELLQEGVHVTQHHQSPLYLTVMRKATEWGNKGNLMFVVGATQAESLQVIRQQFPDYFFLVPGVGTQGGSLAAVSKAALTQEGGLLVNVSRAIIYASEDEDYAAEACAIAHQYAVEMSEHLAAL